MFSIIGGRIRCEMGKSGHECYTEQLHPRVRPVCFVESGRVACFQNTEHRKQNNCTPEYARVACFLRGEWASAHHAVMAGSRWGR